MYPHERSLVTQYADRPFALIGVNSDEDREQLKKLKKSSPITWRSFWDGANGPIVASWGIQGWPTIYLIDHEGTICYSNQQSNLYGDELDAKIALLVEKAEAAAKSAD